MSARRTAALGISFSFLSAASLAVACASPHEEQAPSESPAVVTSPDQHVLGEYVVDADPSTGSLVFTRVVESPADEKTPKLGTKNFQQVTPGNIKFATPSSVTGASSTPSALTSPVADAAGCAAGQFCAQITAQNLSGQTVDNLWVEVTSITTGSTVVNHGDRDKGYASGLYAQSGTVDGGVQTSTNYISFTNGAYYYGGLANGSLAARNWRFNVGTTTPFTFRVRVLATFQRANYLATAAGTSGSGFTAYNACDKTTGGIIASTSTTVLSGAQDDGTAKFALPFPVTIYGQTDTAAWISANGVFGLGTTTSSLYANAALPNTSCITGYGCAPTPGVFAFWDDLQSGSDGAVCTAQATTSSGGRVFVATWQNYGFYTGIGSDGSKMTFSVVLREFSDVIELVYLKPTAGAFSGSVTGTGATFGVQNGTGTVATQISNNAAFLPAASATTYPVRYLLTPSTDPVACDAGGCNGG